MPPHGGKGSTEADVPGCREAEGRAAATVGLKQHFARTPGPWGRVPGDLRPEHPASCSSHFACRGDSRSSCLRLMRKTASATRAVEAERKAFQRPAPEAARLPVATAHSARLAGPMTRAEAERPLKARILDAGRRVTAPHMADPTAMATGSGRLTSVFNVASAAAVRSSRPAPRNRVRIASMNPWRLRVRLCT